MAIDLLYRKIYSGFKLTDEQCRFLVGVSAEEIVGDKGQKEYHFCYDRRLAIPFQRITPDSPLLDISAIWNNISVEQIMVIRGANSVVLSEQALEDMKKHPAVKKVLIVQEVGHAPTLLTLDQIIPIADFLKP